MGGRSENKAGYFDKLKSLLEAYSSIFIVGVDNVSSQQMHEIRLSLRGEGVVLMGKNTMVRSSCAVVIASIRDRELTRCLSRFAVPLKALSQIPQNTSVFYRLLRAMLDLSSRTEI